MLQNGSGVHPASYESVQGTLLWVKLPERELKTRFYPVLVLRMCGYLLFSSYHCVLTHRDNFTLIVLVLVLAKTNYSLHGLTFVLKTSYVTLENDRPFCPGDEFCRYPRLRGTSAALPAMLFKKTTSVLGETRDCWHLGVPNYIIEYINQTKHPHTAISTLLPQHKIALQYCNCRLSSVW
jgi:hypothetical protein